MEDFLPRSHLASWIGLLNSVVKVCSPFGGVVKRVYRPKPYSQRGFERLRPQGGKLMANTLTRR
jgi:hypothetical protein